MEQEQTQEQDLGYQGEVSPSEEIATPADGREQYAKELLGKAQKAVKVIKILVCVAGGLAGVLLLYGILALTVMKNNTQGALIGFLVILGFVAAVFITLVVMFIYAKINLDKLKKLN